MAEKEKKITKTSIKKVNKFLEGKDLSTIILEPKTHLFGDVCCFVGDLKVQDSTEKITLITYVFKIKEGTNLKEHENIFTEKLNNYVNVIFKDSYF